MNNTLQKLLNEKKISIKDAYTILSKTGTRDQYCEIIQKLLDGGEIDGEEAYNMLLDVINTQPITIPYIPTTPYIPSTPYPYDSPNDKPWRTTPWNPNGPTWDPGTVWCGSNYTYTNGTVSQTEEKCTSSEPENKQ